LNLFCNIQVNPIIYITCKRHNINKLLNLTIFFSYDTYFSQKIPISSKKYYFFLATSISSFINYSDHNLIITLSLRWLKRWCCDEEIKIIQKRWVFWEVAGILRKKLSSPFHHPHLTSRNSVFETPGEKSGGSRTARLVGTSREPPDFSPGVSKTELREVKCGWWNGLDSFFLKTPGYSLYVWKVI
jgi:hypothetical protein